MSSKSSSLCRQTAVGSCGHFHHAAVTIARGLAIGAKYSLSLAIAMNFRCMHLPEALTGEAASWSGFRRNGFGGHGICVGKACRSPNRTDHKIMQPWAQQFVALLVIQRRLVTEVLDHTP